MKVDSCFEFGKIIKPHGVKGEVSVTVVADNSEELKKVIHVFIEINSRLIPFIIEKLTISQKRAIIKFEDINSEEETESLMGQKIYLPLADLPPLKSGQFYYHEIVNYIIEDQEKGKLGVVKEIFEMPGQDLIAMDYNGQEVLIPMESSIVLNADHIEKVLKVNLPNGLLELYTDLNANNIKDDED